MPLPFVEEKERTGEKRHFTLQVWEAPKEARPYLYVVLLWEIPRNSNVSNGWGLVLVCMYVVSLTFPLC